MKWALWLLPLALAAVGAEDEVTAIAVGQACWRPRATVTERTLPDGTQRNVQVDLYGLVLDQPTPVHIAIRAEGKLGVIVKAVDRNDEHGEPVTAGLVGRTKPLDATLPAGRYMLLVCADPPTDGAYLLSVARPPQPQGTVAGTAAEGRGLLGKYQPGGTIDTLDVSGDGHWLATGGGTEAWLLDLRTAQRFRLPHPTGPVLRVAFAPDGWTVMVVTAQGAVLLALPDLAPVARFTAQTGVRDAVYLGRRQQVAVQPADGATYLSSPIEGDLAYLPGTKGGLSLVSEPTGTGLAVLRPNREIVLFDLSTRELLGRAKWPAAPSSLALQPGKPCLAGAGPGASYVWQAGQAAQSTPLPEASAVSWSITGRLALALADRVRLQRDQQQLDLQPSVAARLVQFSAGGERLAAATADGAVYIWDLAAVTPGADGEVPPLTRARVAHTMGLEQIRKHNWSAAHRYFADCLDLLRQSPATNDRQEFTCQCLLRLSQTSYGAQDWAASLAEAAQLLSEAAKLPDGKLKETYLASGWYGQADAQWELGRQDEARAGYQKALDHGLAGAAADDARAKLKP